MGEVVVAIAGAAIEVLLQNLISLCREEISLLGNFKKDLEKLKSSLVMIQAFLSDAETQQMTKQTVKRWLYNLEAVTFVAENVLDEFNYEVLCKKMETRNKLKKRVKSFFSTQTMARKIRDINDNLKIINQEATDFGLQKHVCVHASIIGTDTIMERETDSYSVDPIVYGREYHVSRIVEMLTCHDENAVLSVLPIVGMGGLGKTTLASLVFHDDKIETHFEKRICVYVSESFDAKDLFRKILDSLTGQKVDFETKDALLRNLREKLEAKRYLLVLDDVWTEETMKWGDFFNTLLNVSSAKGNSMIVTTRSEKVASIVGTIRIPQLSNLSNEDCWSIIKEKAFEKRHVVPLELEAIGKRIAKKCQGLPLAAKVVGGLLRGKSEDELNLVEETKLSSFGKDGITVGKILKLSFDNLPSQSLKKCFAFCSIFPKGFCIKREMLIFLWMSEGFLQNEQGYDAETVGEKYVDLLLQNSLLQVGGHEENANAKYYNMHDLVHDLGSSTWNETSAVRYMYLKSTMDISKEEERNLRSLIFEVVKDSDKMMFSDLKYLHSLFLLGDDNKELPNVEELIHLRYLDISATKTEHLPKSIVNL